MLGRDAVRPAPGSLSENPAEGAMEPMDMKLEVVLQEIRKRAPGR